MVRQGGQSKFTNPQGGAAFKVHININARHHQVKNVDAKGGLVTIDLACDNGSVNQELTSFLKDLFNVKTKDIEILDGASALDKVVCVLGQSVEAINKILKTSV